MALKVKLGALAMALSLGVAGAASSSDLLFTWSNNGTGNSESWIVNTASITADQFNQAPYDYIDAPISGDTAGQAAVYFGDSTVGSLFGTGIFRTASPFGVNPVFSGQIFGTFFTGPNTNPTLKFGPGTVYNVVGGSTLTISAVPEPVTWAMLIVGVAMIGFAARRRSEGAAVAA